MGISNWVTGQGSGRHHSRKEWITIQQIGWSLSTRNKVGKFFWEINSMGKNSVQGNERNSLTTTELNKNSFSKKDLRKRIIKTIEWIEEKRLQS